jgi:hypothetical protein
MSVIMRHEVVSRFSHALAACADSDHIRLGHHIPPRQAAVGAALAIGRREDWGDGSPDCDDTNAQSAALLAPGTRMGGYPK